MKYATIDTLASSAPPLLVAMGQRVLPLKKGVAPRKRQ